MQVNIVSSFHLDANGTRFDLVEYRSSKTNDPFFYEITMIEKDKGHERVMSEFNEAGAARAAFIDLFSRNCLF